MAKKSKSSKAKVKVKRKCCDSTKRCRGCPLRPENRALISR